MVIFQSGGTQSILNFSQFGETQSFLSLVKHICFSVQFHSHFQFSGIQSFLRNWWNMVISQFVGALSILNFSQFSETQSYLSLVEDSHFLKNWLNMVISQFGGTLAITAYRNYYYLVMSPSRAGSSWRIFSSARLVTFSPSARNQKSAQNEPIWYLCS